MSREAVTSLIFVLMWLPLGESVVTSQSLAEVAKKEQKRRSENNIGTITTITNRELATRYGGLPTAAQRTEPATEEMPKVEAEVKAELEKPPADEFLQKRQYWQQQWHSVNLKIEKIEAALKQEDWGNGVGMNVNPIGENNLSRRQELVRQLAAARSERSAIKEEARREGVPAGWLR